MRKIQIQMGLIALFIILILWKIISGLDYTDTPFNILNMTNGNLSDFPMLPLTLLCGKLWNYVFGNNMLSFRILTALLFILRIGITGLIGKRLFPKQDGFSLYYLSGAIVAAGIWIPCPGLDSFSDLMLTLFLYFSLRVWQRGSLLNWVYLGFAILLNAGFRLPNIVSLIPATILLIIIIQSFQKTGTSGYIKSITGLGLGILIPLISIIVSGYGSFLISLPENIKLAGSVSTHSPLMLFKTYLNDIYGILVYFFAYTGILFTGILIRNSSWSKYHKAFIIISLLACYVSALNTEEYRYLTPFSSFITAISLYLFIYIHKNINNKKELLIPVFILICIVTPSMGSNTGFWKITSFALLGIPFMMFWIQNSMGNASEKKLLSEHAFIPLFKTSLHSLMIIGIFIGIHKAYGDTRKFYKRLHTIEHPLLKGIFTTKERAGYISRVSKEFDIITENSEFVFIGESAHFFTYLSGKKPFIQLPFWTSSQVSAIETELSDKIKNNSNKKHTIFYIPGSQNNTSWPAELEETTDWQESIEVRKLKNLLVTYGFNLQIKQGYIIFEKDSEN